MRVKNYSPVISVMIGTFILVHCGEAATVRPDDPTFSWLFDDGAGTTAAAQFGTHNGTLNGGSSFNSVNTPFNYSGNYAIELNGTNGFVQVADAAELRPGTSAWTTSAWFRVPDANQVGSIITKRQNGGVFNQWANYIGNSTSSIAAGKQVHGTLIEGNVNRWWYYTDNNVVDGDWHHIAMVRPATGNAILYIDGVAVAISSLFDNNSEPQNINNTDPWQFGSNNGSGYFLNGLIDEVGMWNTALSADNIAWLAANSLSTPPPAPEPSSFLLLGLGALGLVRRARLRKIESE